MNVIYTQKSVKSILVGLLIIIFGDVILDILFPLDYSSFSGLSDSFIRILASASAVLIGYVIYFKGLKKFATQLDEYGSKGVKISVHLLSWLLLALL